MVDLDETMDGLMLTVPFGQMFSGVDPGQPKEPSVFTNFFKFQFLGNKPNPKGYF